MSRSQAFPGTYELASGDITDCRAPSSATAQSGNVNVNGPVAQDYFSHASTSEKNTSGWYIGTECPDS